MKAALIVESPHIERAALDSVRACPHFAGASWTLAATFGHLFNFRDQPFDLQWVPNSLPLIEQFVERIADQQLLVVATDPDEEGERIAYQAYALAKEVNPEAKIIRLKTHAWVPDIVEQALNDRNKTQFNPQAATNAERRRVFDRMIGMAFGAPGRIKGAFLRSWQEEPPQERYSKSGVIVKPPSCFDLLMESTRHGLTVKEAYEQMCDAWTRGEITYPRTDGTLYDPTIAAMAIKIAQRQGVRKHADTDALIGENGSHTALVPTSDRPAANESSILGILRDLTAAAVNGRPRRRPASGQKMSADARWLEVAQRDRLGKPSTISGHIEKLETLVDKETQAVRPAMLKKLSEMPSALTTRNQQQLEKEIENPRVRLSKAFEQLSGIQVDSVKTTSWAAARSFANENNLSCHASSASERKAQARESIEIKD